MPATARADSRVIWRVAFLGLELAPVLDEVALGREVLRHFLTREGYLGSAVADGREVLDKQQRSSRRSS